MHDLDFDDSDVDTALPDDDDDVVCNLLVSGGSVFLCGPVQCAAIFVEAVRMALSLDEGLQLDGPATIFENSLEDHGVSRQLVLDKIALEVSVWQRCRPLQRALTAHQLLRRREGVSILGDIAPSQEAFFLSLQLLDMSHKRWSPCNASVALEFGEIHSLAAAAFVTRKLVPERESGRGSAAAAASTAAGTWTSATSAHFIAHSSCSQSRQTLAPTTP